MSQVALAARSSQIHRDAVITKAQRLGFTRMELIDCHRAIASRLARSFAMSCESHDMQDLPERAQYIIPLLTFTGATVSEAVEEAVVAMAELPKEGHFYGIREIADLLDLHARFTQSYPADMEFKDWFNELTDISVELRASVDLVFNGDRLRGDAMLDKACRRLARVFGHLWS